jgi:drug/metabolite transporter (DMT)-like permease
MACSIACFLTYTSSEKMKWYYGTVFFAILAAYANFTFLIFWAAVQILLLANFLLRKYDWRMVKSVLLKTAGINLAFMALCYTPLTGIGQCLQNNFANSGTFYQDVVISEIETLLYGKHLPGLSYPNFAILVFIVIIVASVLVLRKVKSNLPLALTDPFSLVLLLLLLVYAINTLQVYISNTVYPGGRTGLMYYVLFIFVLIFLLREIVLKKVFGAKALLVVVTLFFVFNFSRNVNLKSVYEWSYDAYTADVINAIDDYRHKHPGITKIELKPAPYFQYSFVYYAKCNKLTWLTFHDPLGEIMINNLADTVPQVVFCYTAAGKEAAGKAKSTIKTFTATGLPAPLYYKYLDSVQTLFIAN